MKKIVFVALMVLCSASFGASVEECQADCRKNYTSNDQLIKCMLECQTIEPELGEGDIRTPDSFDPPYKFDPPYDKTNNAQTIGK